MSKRTVLTAIVLVTAGILFGAVLVTGFSGISLSLADSGTKFNTTAPYAPSEGVTSLNDAFTSVSNIVTPQVVAITVKSKMEGGGMQHFWPFGDMVPKDDGERLQQGSGSGIIITGDGYILTNKHVVEGATENGIRVLLNDSREFDAKLIGADQNTDIAVIKIDVKNLPAAALGNSDEVKVGEWVLAVGNPMGLNSTVTAGIVSAISRNIGLLGRRSTDGTGIENFIQTDAAINPGNSGGALVNLRGQVIGVNSAIASQTGQYVGYGFAVPINLARVVANGIIKDGKFVRGYIGVRISNLDAKKARGFGSDLLKGVLVESVQEDGAGKAAGIKEGDIIVQVDGKDVQSANELQARVGMHHPGEAVRIKLFRGKTPMEMDVKLKGRSEDDAKAASDDEDKPEKDESLNSKSSLSFDKAGFTVKPLDAEAKKKFSRSTGVIVSNVKQYGPAFENNLRAGVVIFEVRKGGAITKIETMADLKKALGSLGKDETVMLRVAIDGGDTAFVPIDGPVD